MNKKLFIAISLIFIMCVNFAFSAFAHGDEILYMFEITDAEKRYEQKLLEDGQGDGWEWNSETLTLTLSGIKNGRFSSYHVAGLQDAITIVLKDGTVNEFAGGLFLNGCDYIIKGNGKLVMEPATNVLYDENGNYLTDENGHSVYGSAPDLMDWNSTITIEGGDITAKMRGVHLQGRLIMNGGSLKLECGIFGGLGGSTSKAIINGGELITSLPDINNLDKYTSAKSVVEFYKQDFDSPMICGLEECKATGKNGEQLIWKKTTDEEGFERLNLYDQNGNLATYAKFAPSNSYTKTGEKADEWSIGAIDSATKNGILPLETEYGFKSDTNNSADLTQNITRGQFTALVVGLYERVTEKELELGKIPFSDVRYIYENYVRKAYNAGLINGVSDTEFNTDALLTREQASSILYRAYVKLGGDTKESDSKFNDDADISQWAKEAVYMMAEKEFLLGVGDNNFSPKTNTQIQQAIVIAMRMFDYFK